MKHHSAPLAVATALTAAFVFGAIVWALMTSEALQGGPAHYLAEVPALGLCASLIVAIRNTPRLDLVEFTDHRGRPTLRIVRERRQADDCMAFVDDLVAHIEIAQSDLPPESRATMLKQLTGNAAPAAGAHFETRKWKPAIVLGALAAFVPMIPGINEALAELMFPLIFVLGLGALVLAVVSFTSREPGRWLSVFAILLALVPLFLY